LTPFGERGGAVLLEGIATVEVAVLVEIIVDRGLVGGEFPRGFISLNLAMAPSRRRNGRCEFSVGSLSHRPQA
jgi:hypothetical protein